MSSLKDEIKRIGDLLQGSTAEQIRTYKGRFRYTKKFYENFLERLIVQGYDRNQVYETVQKLWGCDEVWFAAIDGSRFYETFFDIVVFYGGAYACLGKIRFHEDEELEITYLEQYLEKGQGISSCVPLYISQVPEVDEVFFAETKEKETKPGLMLGDDVIIDNTQIANRIMEFAEFFLAYKFARDGDRNIKFILLDRTLSGNQASLIASTSKPTLWSSRTSLLGYEVDGVTLDENDLAYGRFRFLNKDLDLPPPRGDFLRYRILLTLEEKGSVTAIDLCSILGIDSKDRKERIEKNLGFLKRRGYVTEKKGVFQLRDRYKTSWACLKKLVDRVGEHLFLEEPSDISESNRMKIKVDGEERWLTTLDLYFLTLFCLYMLIEEAWKKKILVVGITKDTAAKDFNNHFIPICHNSGFIQPNEKAVELARLPFTDRMLLQTLSILNYESLKTPWSLVEYDTVFKTLVPDMDRGSEFVRGAIRNKTSPERLFLKTYIQLLASEDDPKFRSNVLCIDRLALPQLDLKPERQCSFINHYGGADEPVKPLVFLSNRTKNELQNLILGILYQMTGANIPELFGHNKPLFIADKIAKWHTGTAMKVVKSIKRWVASNPDLRDFVFYMSTFRERRERFEYRRGKR